MTTTPATSGPDAARTQPEPDPALQPEPARDPFLERFLRSCTPVGGVFRLDYDTAVVSTDDLRKKETGGLARGSFLLAAATYRDETGLLRLEEPEVILLRVRDVADLPNERALTESRESVVAESWARGLDYADVADVMTQAVHQRGAVACDVLGTYYADPVTGRTAFGADIDNVYSSAVYQVFVPSEKALSWIGSFPGPSGEHVDPVLPLGVVRYASTRRKAHEVGLSGATVNVHVSDFVGKRTAVFGMTRVGKALTHDTRLPVPVSDRFPEGWARNEELVVGDLVYAPDGSETPIIGFTDWRTERVYEVHFADGQVVRVGANHNWFASSDQSRSNESCRREKSGRKTARVRALEELAAESPGGTYATLKDLSRLSGLHVDYLRPLVKRGGLEGRTTWSPETGDLLRVAVKKTLMCWPVAEAWPLLVEKAGSLGDTVAETAQQPDDAWCSTRELVEALLGRPGVDRKHVAKYGGFLRSRGVEWRYVERTVPEPYRGAMLYPAGEVLLLAAAAATSRGGTPMPVEQVVTTAEMAASLRSSRRRGNSNNWAVRVPGAIEGADRALPLDPYVLGAWLGDGHSRHDVVTAGTSERCQDPATGVTDQHHMLTQLLAAGESTAHLLNDARGVLVGVPGMRSKLRAAGVWGAKHIPAIYLRASRAQRLALLQGLMDTDGTVDRRGICELTLSDARLASDALELLRSLGIRASRATGGASYRDEHGRNVECKERHRINFTPTQQVFRLPRKAARVDIRTSPVTRWNPVTDIRESGDGRLRCITVAHHSGLHLVEGFIATHNSNTIKTIVTAVYRYAAETGQKVGQVVFDPQGEYANVNRQDGTGLRLLGGPDQVRVYTSKPRPGEAQERPLRLNFYDVALFPVIWDMACDSMRHQDTSYTKRFVAADMEAPDPTDHSALTHWNRGRVAFYGLLARAGYKGGFVGTGGMPFSMKDVAATQFATETGITLQGGSGKYLVSTPVEAAAVTEWVGKLLGALEKARKGTREVDAEEAKRLDDLVGKWGESEQFLAVNEVFHHVRGRGLAGLREMRDFHDPGGTGDLAEWVWEDMVDGRLVIVDLSIGSETVTKVMSERLVTALVTQASNRFRNDLDPVPFQVVVEEAHNLFERGRDVVGDPWVRMSKEAAKYRIGLVYATQEVTSVDRRILSNTSNWVIAHLNSANETTELARYYDFSSFAERLRRVEDVGFVVMKTHSSPYLVPMQVAKFDHAMINAARVAAGLRPVDATGAEIDPLDAEPDDASGGF